MMEGSTMRLRALTCELALVWGGVATAGAQRAFELRGDVGGTHDPSIAKDGGTYYVFATGKAPGGGQFAVRCSEDLVQWRRCGQVFDAVPAWIGERSPATKDLWAPDVSFVKGTKGMKGEYRLYYAYSLFGKNTSGIGLAVNKTLDQKSADYKWVDKGLVLESKKEDNFNAIDPNYVQDEKGRGWLSFGSFWDGIKMVRLDVTGLQSTSDMKVYSVARRVKPGNDPGIGDAHAADGLAATVTTLPSNWQAIEAPFVVRHGGYFYLFTSWDLCCRGTKSTYRTMVGRAKSVTGPYVDQTGKKLEDGGGTELLIANGRWLGPGGESLLMGAAPGGKDLIVFHAYDATTGRPSLQLSTIEWVDGWPRAALAAK